MSPDTFFDNVNQIESILFTRMRIRGGQVFLIADDHKQLQRRSESLTATVDYDKHYRGRRSPMREFSAYIKNVHVAKAPAHDGDLMLFVEDYARLLQLYREMRVEFDIGYPAETIARMATQMAAMAQWTQNIPPSNDED